MDRKNCDTLALRASLQHRATRLWGPIISRCLSEEGNFWSIHLISQIYSYYTGDWQQICCLQKLQGLLFNITVLKRHILNAHASPELSTEWAGSEMQVTVIFSRVTMHTQLSFQALSYFQLAYTWKLKKEVILSLWKCEWTCKKGHGSGNKFDYTNP